METQAVFSDSLPDYPDDYLIERDYKRFERVDSPFNRTVWYRKRIDRPSENFVFVVEIKYDLVIGDDPHCSYLDNLTYCFEEVRLVVWERLYNEVGEVSGKTEVGQMTLFPKSLDELEKFASVLGFETSPSD